HKEIKDVSGAELDAFIAKAKAFVTRMEQLLTHLQKERKLDLVKKNYEIMVKAAVAGLKKMEKLPPDPKDLPGAIKTYLIDTNRVDAYYGDVFKKVVTMRKMLDEDRIAEIPQRDIEMTREYVRRFVRDMASVVEGGKKK
ncbi:MAG: hypothetical protein HY365_01900, partial [Candidatus Aenigmarchaeota archaeon]|nr:hypothetical protein [Candidatus Aenigmarchaeota archaeon]